jgi:hypothetical protein
MANGKNTQNNYKINTMSDISNNLAKTNMLRVLITSDLKWESSYK